MVKVGINGFGRIGRLILRALKINLPILPNPLIPTLTIASPKHT